ncbi:MAG: sodium-dependent transporter [Muribaculaceae bacterium]|nr:sodium-dependent transporter [Muribaculaceae bacterium]
MSNNNLFKTKIGLIAATVGSAVGLGSVWRFPSEVQTNGGAAFLIVYIACVFLLGIPVMLAEFSLGRAGRSDAVGSFRNLAPGKMWWLGGALAILTSYLILCYYMVVAGWTFEYMWESITGNLYAGIDAAADKSAMFGTKMQQYITHDTNPLIHTFIIIGINIAILLFGVQKGIERLSNIMMPLLFVILLGFCVVSLTLPKANEGLAFFLNPDFSAITPSVVIRALGQAFFSLSLGMGVLITYGSYFPRDTRLIKTSVSVSTSVIFVAVMMGVIIFPAVTSFGLQDATLNGPTLVFATLPQVFAQLPAPQLWSTLFFLLLTLAAVTSTISIAEVSIAFMQEFFKLSRKAACLVVLLPLLVFSTVCSLSLGSLSDFTVFGLTIFDLLDYTTANILLPVCSILLCVYVGWFAPKKFLKNELTNNGEFKSSTFRFIVFVIRYIAPVLITGIIVYSFL